MRSRAALFAGGAFAGIVAGWLVAQYRFTQHRQALFSGQPLRRMAALGFLAGQHDIETIRLLRAYLAWETHPVLRRRADGIMRKMEEALG